MKFLLSSSLHNQQKSLGTFSVLAEFNLSRREFRTPVSRKKNEGGGRNADQGHCMQELLSESEVLVKEYCSIHAIPAAIAAQGRC